VQAPAEKLSITVIILTLNEQIHIERCIASVASFVQRISSSTRLLGRTARSPAPRAEVTQRAFKHQADHSVALDIARSDRLVLRLDADEYFEPSLARKS